MSLSEFAAHLKPPFSSAINLQKEKLWGFAECHCSIINARHFVAEKKPIYHQLYTINFQADKVEITNCNDYDRRILTHLFLNSVKVYEAR